MPASITTLPPELIFKIFGNLDRIGTATRLSQTCRAMRDTWRAHRRVLSMTLVQHHPVFWRYEDRYKTDKMVTSLWEYAKVYDDALGGKFSSSVLSWASNLHIPEGNGDGFVTAKRILQMARSVRRVALMAHQLFFEFAVGQTTYFRDEEYFRVYAEYYIGRMLYMYITMSITKQPYPRIGRGQMNDICWLASFVNRHLTLPAGFPALGRRINGGFDWEERDLHATATCPRVIEGVENGIFDMLDAARGVV
jgi:hypothetical protein